MSESSAMDYSAFDRPEISNFLFYPRPEPRGMTLRGNVRELAIPVDNKIVIGARFYAASKTGPVMLFFHGNGEIVADYDDLADEYVRMGINFLPVDYRGYGKSSGSPSVTAMMRDCHAVFEYVRTFRKDEGFTGPLILMGRSLGSASAAELVSEHAGEIDALIIESGFAYIVPLLDLLGVNAARLGITEEKGPRNLDKIGAYDKPTLIIHAEYDHIIPFSDGRALFTACGSKNKKLLEIKEANHNNIFLYGHEEYMRAVKEIADKVSAR